MSPIVIFRSLGMTQRQPPPSAAPETVRAVPGGDARNACLVGENSTCSVPALYGCEGLYSLTTTAMPDNG